MWRTVVWLAIWAHSCICELMPGPLGDDWSRALAWDGSSVFHKVSQPLAGWPRLIPMVAGFQKKPKEFKHFLDFYLHHIC